MAKKIKKLAIFGGSFSPPHMGHVLSARAYLNESGADEILIIPAKRPPHKSLDGMADDMQRLEMCRLAFCEDEVLSGRCIVSDFELSQDAVSYTVNTVEHFIAQGYDDVSILIGTDMLLSFETWHRYKDLFRLVSIYYMDRYDHSKRLTKETAERFRKEYGARVIPLEVPVFEASSTDIREKLICGHSVCGMLSDKVYEYILKNRLYKQA